MDTRVFYVAIISIAIGGAIWQMGGFAELFAGQSPGEQLESSDEVRDQANDSAIQGEFEGDARANEGSLVGMVLSAGSQFFSLLGLVVFLPSELMELMLPRWFAVPVGNLASLFISIGLIQIVAGRVYR